eukprot:3457578-Pyramimonas_sp.AAC.1
MLGFPELVKFSAERNQLSGQMPCPPLGSKLTSMSLARNMLTGTLPACLSQVIATVTVTVRLCDCVTVTVTVLSISVARNMFIPARCPPASPR